MNYTTNQEQLKECTKCKEKKTTDYFYKHKDKKDGLQDICKLCHYNRTREWYKEKGSEYRVWQSMKDRCSNKNNPDYDVYGRRGISVCKSWNESYDNFINDMGRRTTDKHTLERIDNDDGYKKDNCEWATRGEQVRNRSVFKKSVSGVTGVTWIKPSSQWKASIDVNYKRIHLGYYGNLDDAIEARKHGELKHWKSDTLT